MKIFRTKIEKKYVGGGDPVAYERTDSVSRFGIVSGSPL